MREIILKVLNDSEDYISGEKLSNICGVSRTAVWKHINNLKEEGYQIETQPRIGYKLVKRPDSLIKAEILQDLNTAKWGREYLYTFAEVTSTNKVARELANEGKPEGTIVVAEHQTLGKGRLGREWISPKEKGVWLSLILRPNILPVDASQITFVIAVGMVNALKKQTGLDVKIKWPNDILINMQKICGILIEISAEIERVNYLVVGIGVNANQKENDFPEELKSKATSLKIATGHTVERVKVLKTILEELEKVYNDYLQNGFTEILRQWKENSVTLGKEVMVIMGEETVTGFAFDVNNNGNLLLKDYKGKIHNVLAGDVSIRSINGNYI